MCYPSLRLLMKRHAFTPADTAFLAFCLSSSGNDSVIIIALQLVWRRPNLMNVLLCCLTTLHIVMNLFTKLVSDIVSCKSWYPWAWLAWMPLLTACALTVAESFELLQELNKIMVGINGEPCHHHLQFLVHHSRSLLPEHIKTIFAVPFIINSLLDVQFHFGFMFELLPFGSCCPAGLLVSGLVKGNVHSFSMVYLTLDPPVVSLVAVWLPHSLSN